MNLLSLLAFFTFISSAWASNTPWEKQSDFYFLSKATKDYFSAPGAGGNQFTSKYLTYDKIDFWVKGLDVWKDYGRINLEGNNQFAIPIKPGTKVEEVHLLAGGNYGNSYKHDLLLGLYGENYYYGTIQMLFAYQDGIYKEISVPIFWDWFHLGTGEWSRNGGKIRSVGINPVRGNCNLYHITFINPRPQEPLKDILISDSWVEDFPFSDIFAVTLKSADSLEAIPKENK
jgi:hypothetical protein